MHIRLRLSYAYPSLCWAGFQCWRGGGYGHLFAVEPEVHQALAYAAFWRHWGNRLQAVPS